ncbi:ATP-binding cassette domain-containing protein [Bosea vestrisii]|uniref:ATP-binding cassette domain-containing protein n=1 Tax=Bosea vestrisii TaxID=151416 RepID=UPI003D76841C
MSGAADPVPVLEVRDLQAHFRTHYFGVNREVRAVDGVTFDVNHNEIYGLAGESSSGKTTLIKTIAGLLKPPLEMVGGSARFSFLPGWEAVGRAPPEVVRRPSST